MILRSPQRSVMIALLAVGLATPALAGDVTADLRATMAAKLDGACKVAPEKLARMEPRMAVVHAVVEQTSLPSGWARLKVLKPVLGGLDRGERVPVSHFRRGLGGGQGAHFVEGKEYLISMYAFRNFYIVDRALECQA
jgi:hypothetical protein